MSVNQEDVLDLEGKAISRRKRQKRDGLKSCSHCNSSVGLRAKQCSNCKHPFPVKTKDWNAIERHSATMKETYIKDKIFDRIDQLATKPGWTGVVFLVHENAESKSGQKRIFQHSYSTKGAGRKIEEAMRTKVFKAMKSFMYEDANEQEKESSKDADQQITMEMEVTSQEAETAVFSDNQSPVFSEASFAVLPASPAPALQPLSSSSTTPMSSCSTSVCTTNIVSSFLSTNTKSVFSSPTCSLPIPRTMTKAFGTSSSCPFTATSFSTPRTTLSDASSVANPSRNANTSFLDSSPKVGRFKSPSLEVHPTVNNNLLPAASPLALSPASNVSCPSTSSSCSSVTSALSQCSSTSSTLPINPSHRKGKIVEANGRMYFILDTPLGKK